MSEKKYELSKNVLFFIETLSATTKISFFFYNGALHTITSDSEWENHMKNFFLLNCPLNELHDLSHNNISTSFYYVDSLFLNYFIIPLPKASSFLIMGPTLISDFDITLFQKKLEYNEMSVHSKINFMKMAQDIPVISANQLVEYGRSVFYALYTTQPKNIKTLTTDFKNSASPDTSEPILDNKQATTLSPHGSRYTEEMILYNVKHGILSSSLTIESSTSTIIGNMAPGNPLRQTKNAIIVLVALITRAALSGGMTSEEAYSLSDLFIQQIELSENINDINSITEKMYRTFITAVHKTQQNTYSNIVKYTLNYITSHTKEAISLKDISNYLGYDGYYISRQFKKETGLSVNEYINKLKIDYATVLLRTTALPINEISEQLSFCSPTYFATQFKKIQGISPNFYRKNL